MVRFRQGHWGQASWVPRQDPVGSQLTMATWVAAEGAHALLARGWRRRGAQAEGGPLLWGFLIIRGKFLMQSSSPPRICHLLPRRKQGWQFQRHLLTPHRPSILQDEAMGTSHLSNQDCSSQRPPQLTLQPSQALTP